MNPLLLIVKIQICSAFFSFSYLDVFAFFLVVFVVISIYCLLKMSFRFDQRQYVNLSMNDTHE